MNLEKQKMLSGELYDPASPDLVEARISAKVIFMEFNRSDPQDTDHRQAILRRLLGSMGKDASIEPPLYCDYGFNIHIGNGVHINFNCTILDPAVVRIGDGTLLGPSVQIYTPLHPLDRARRVSMLETAKPVEIGKAVWIGGGAIICPGVSIGDGSVIGAGSVVTRDIPAGVLAAGNPCRIIRALGEDAQ